MITVKTDREIQLMRDAGRLTAEVMELAGSLVKPGVSTKEIDDRLYKFIKKHNATPSFLNYYGYPATACISVNEVVIHGIPSGQRIIADGDIVSIDVGVLLNGYHADMARTFCAGNVSEEAKKLIEVTKESFWRGIAKATDGARVGDIGHAIESYVHENGFSVVEDYVGHGVGTHLHEDPDVPNYGKPGRGMRLRKGMTIAVEPMINAGCADVVQLKDGWTVVTKDGKLSAHYENTIAITDGEPLILTSL